MLIEINCHPVDRRKDESGLYRILLTQVVVFVGHRNPFAYTTFIIYVSREKAALSPEGVFWREGEGDAHSKNSSPPLAIIPTPYFFSIHELFYFHLYFGVYCYVTLF